MASNCGISGGYSFDCNDKVKAIGGIKNTFWIGNLEDIDRTYGTDGFNISGAGFVTDIKFKYQKGLYEFGGVRLGNSNTDDAARNEGGIPNFPVSIAFKMYDNAPDDALIVEQLANADALFAIQQTSSGDFKIFGSALGLNLASAPRASGTQPTDDSSRLVTLSGVEPKLPRYFFKTSQSITLALIQSYVL